MCLALLIKDYSLRDCSCGRRGLQNLQLHFTTDFEPRFYANRQRDVSARDMSGTKAKRHRNSEISDYTQHNFFESVILRRSLPAIQHFAEDNAANAFQLARQFQLHQHAINLVRLSREVLHEKN